MEVTHSGVTGDLIVVNRADWEVSIALVHTPIPRQQTKEDTTWGLIRKIFHHVTFVTVQVTFTWKKCVREKNNNTTMK